MTPLVLLAPWFICAALMPGKPVIANAASFVGKRYFVSSGPPYACALVLTCTVYGYGDGANDRGAAVFFRPGHEPGTTTTERIRTVTTSTVRTPDAPPATAIAWKSPQLRRYDLL